MQAIYVYAAKQNFLSIDKIKYFVNMNIGARVPFEVRGSTGEGRGLRMKFHPVDKLIRLILIDKPNPSTDVPLVNHQHQRISLSLIYVSFSTAEKCYSLG